MIGGAAGIIAFILALRHAGVLGRVQEKATEAKEAADTLGGLVIQQHQKINELADKNPADVAPMPPMPVCPPREEK